MILIISHSGGTVNKVIDWIDSKGIKVHRINPYIDKVNIHAIELSNKTLDFELELEGYGIKTKLSDYTGIWIWHSHVWFKNCEPVLLTQEKNEITNEVENSLHQHHNILISYFSDFLLHSDCKTIGNYEVQNLNKLQVLLKAKLLGISIPDTYILSQKKQFEELINNTNIITKPYHEIAMCCCAQTPMNFS